MLTRDLLRYSIDDDRISPALIDPGSSLYARATNDLYRIFRGHIGKTKGEIEVAIDAYISTRTDYRILRGLAHVLSSFAEFESRRSDAARLRTLVFERAARDWPLCRESGRQSILDDVSKSIGMISTQLEDGLFSDLPERQRLIAFNPPSEPKQIIARYNMELARGLLYWAEKIVIDVGDSYQDVFRYIKLCRLMHRISRL